MGEKIFGRNALVYVGTSVVPQSNSVTISYTRELQEIRVFQDIVTGNTWSDQIPGFSSWTIEISGFYDTTDTVAVDSSIMMTGKRNVVVYETRATLTRYWYGEAYFNFNENISVDSPIDFSMSGTGTGALTRID